VLTGGFTSDDPDIGSILEELQVVEARFFTNAIDTRTRGVDFTLSHRADAMGGKLHSTLALNHNETEVQRINTSPGLAGKEDIYFSTRERFFVEGSAPELKGTGGLSYYRGAWNGGVRLNYFGEVLSGTWTQLDDPSAPPQRYDERLTTDLHLGYAISDALQLTVGGANVFDEEPTAQDPNETENGAFWENVQMGFNGAYWFARIGYRLPGS
jgi:iron complex outermembrane receptor protein